jgi:hypothetical protein
MIRLLWIPLAGTIAAFIVVLLAHEPREEEPGPAFPELPPELPDVVPEVPVPDPATKPEEKPPPKPLPPPAEHHLRLEKDGSLVDLRRSHTFADGAAVIAELVKDERVRDRIFLTNGADVEEAALDEILEKLAAKFEVRKVYRAAEKEE